VDAPPHGSEGAVVPRPPRGDAGRSAAFAEGRRGFGARMCPWHNDLADPAGAPTAPAERSCAAMPRSRERSRRRADRLV